MGTMTFVRLCCRLFVVCSALGILLHHPSAQIKAKIAIIGGGIGGASSAHFLSEMLTQTVTIDLYERNVLGGRMATAMINNVSYEIGASIAHDRNQYMTEFLLKYDLIKIDDESGSIALYDGKGFPFVGSNWQLITLMKLVWRYGKSLARSYGMIEEMLEDFESIYDWQALGKSFPDIKTMVSAMNPKFFGYLNKTTRKGFQEEGMSEKFIDEIILASTKCNYGQDTDIHQFVGSVSLAGIQPGLWSVDGGNKKIVEKLVNDSLAVEIFKEVIEVELLSDGTFNVHTIDTVKHYDVVIIATPLTADAKSPIKFIGFPKEIKLSGKYHHTIVTIVYGRVNYTYFSFASEDSVPDLILSVSNNTFFNSMGRIFPAKNTKRINRSVWKIFSLETLEAEQLDKLFMERYETQVFDWLAYPQYTSYDFYSTNDSFILHEGLFYVNAVEWAASAMEMSAIAGKNAALLAYKSLFPYEYSHYQSFEGIQDIHEEL